MGRLPGFDYKRPFFYMVTLKRAARVLQGAAPAAPTFPGADAPGCKTTAPAAPTTSAADAPGRPTTSCATKP